MPPGILNRSGKRDGKERWIHSVWSQQNSCFFKFHGHGTEWRRLMQRHKFPLQVMSHGGGGKACCLSCRNADSLRELLRTSDTLSDPCGIYCTGAANAVTAREAEWEKSEQEACSPVFISCPCLALNHSIISFQGFPSWKISGFFTAVVLKLKHVSQYLKVLLKYKYQGPVPKVSD
jgi:hypothetical protein